MTKFYDKYGNELRPGARCENLRPGSMCTVGSPVSGGISMLFENPPGSYTWEEHDTRRQLVVMHYSDGSLPEHGPYAKPPGVSTTLDVIEYAPEGPTAPTGPGDKQAEFDLWPVTFSDGQRSTTVLCVDWSAHHLDETLTLMCVQEMNGLQRWMRETKGLPWAREPRLVDFEAKGLFGCHVRVRIDASSMRADMDRLIFRLVGAVPASEQPPAPPAPAQDGQMGTPWPFGRGITHGEVTSFKIHGRELLAKEPTADEKHAALAIESAARHLAKPTLAEFDREVRSVLAGLAPAAKVWTDRGKVKERSHRATLLLDVFLINYEWPDGSTETRHMPLPLTMAAVRSFVESDISDAAFRLGDAALRRKR